jgi:fatty acid desaturase
VAIIDVDKLRVDIDDLKKEVFQDLGKSDLKSLRKLQIIKWMVLAVTHLSGWMMINPLSSLLFAFCDVLRWGDIHHVGHCGYDKVPGAPKNFMGRRYATGWRRFIDWPEWIHPDDWNFEHNVLHHYFTGLDSDPDLVEDKMGQYKNLPRSLRMIAFIFFSLTWKWIYYAPKTFSAGKSKGTNLDLVTPSDLLKINRKEVRELWWRNYLPIILFKFLLIPSLFLLISKDAFLITLINMIIGEFISNVWTFFVIVGNHAGDDVYRFEKKHSSKGEWYLMQILGSVDYSSRNTFTDMLMFWLNFQIPHHIFPNLPHERYRTIAPKLKKICQKHGISYVETGLLVRCQKLYDNFVGNTKMKVWKGSNIEHGLEDMADYGLHSSINDN